MKKFLSIFFNALILFGVLLVAVDAFIYQYNARKREAERCQTIRKLAFDIMLYSHDEPRVVRNAETLYDMAETPETFEWKFGENAKEGTK